MVYLVEDYMFRSIMLFNTPLILSMIIIVSSYFFVLEVMEEIMLQVIM